MNVNVDALKTTGTIVLMAAVFLGVVFLVLYSALARWWESREGWYLFVSSFILAEILAYNLAAVMGWFGPHDPIVQQTIRLAVYTQVLTIMAWRGVLLILAQIEYTRWLKANPEKPVIMEEY